MPRTYRVGDISSLSCAEPLSLLTSSRLECLPSQPRNVVRPAATHTERDGGIGVVRRRRFLPTIEPVEHLNIGSAAFAGAAAQLNCAAFQGFKPPRDSVESQVRRQSPDR